MCVVSMVMDHKYDEWQKYIHPPYHPTPYPQSPPIKQEEIAEFRRLLERARKYDKENKEPDCELESKKEKLRKLADELGVKIDFL